jgi:hypothetical protein
VPATELELVRGRLVVCWTPNLKAWGETLRAGVFLEWNWHACKLGCEGIVSKRLGSRYRSGRSPDWLKMKDSDAPAVKREAEEDWGRERPRARA